MRQSLTSTPSKAVGGSATRAYLDDDVGMRSLTSLHVSLNLSTLIVGFNNSFSRVNM